MTHHNPILIGIALSLLCAWAGLGSDHYVGTTAALTNAIATASDGDAKSRMVKIDNIRNILSAVALAGAVVVLMFVSAAIGVCEMLRGDYRQ